MADQNQTSPKATFIMGLLGGVAVVSTIGFFVLLPKVLNNSGSNDSGTKVINNGATQPTPEPQPEVAADLPPLSNDDYVRGDSSAPITLIEYSDFECPFCLRHVPTVEKVLTEYKGKVKLVYRHFPLSFHPQAQKAAEASECAGEQGKFWEMHDKIFEANSAGAMSVDQWKKVAKELKLNTKKFDECLDTGKYVKKIQQQTASGAASGVSGTPATFVNGKLVSGAVPYEQFKQIIDGLL